MRLDYEMCILGAASSHVSYNQMGEVKEVNLQRERAARSRDQERRVIQDAEGVLRKCEPLVRVIPKPQLGFRKLLLDSRRHPNVPMLNPPFCFKQLELIKHLSLLLQSVKLIEAH